MQLRASLFRWYIAVIVYLECLYVYHMHVDVKDGVANYLDNFSTFAGLEQLNL